MAADVITVFAPSAALQLDEDGVSGKLVFTVRASTPGTTYAIAFGNPSGAFNFGAGPDTTDKPDLTSAELVNQSGVTKIVLFNNVKYSILHLDGTNDTTPNYRAGLTYTFTPPNDEKDTYIYDDFLGDFVPDLIISTVVNGVPTGMAPGAVTIAYNGVGQVGVTDLGIGGPEPSSWILMVAGVAGLGAVGRRNRRGVATARKHATGASATNGARRS